MFGLYVKLVKNRKSSRLTVMDYTIGFLYILTGATVIIDAVQEFEIIVSAYLREKIRQAKSYPLPSAEGERRRRIPGSTG